MSRPIIAGVAFKFCSRYAIPVGSAWPENMLPDPYCDSSFL
jgi:hypothetical protein